MITDPVELRARELFRQHAEESGHASDITWEQALSEAKKEVQDSIEFNRGIYIRQVEDRREAVVELNADVRPQSLDYLGRILSMWALHLKKATGYSGHSEDVWANFRTQEALGVPDEMGVFIRMNDKFNRLKSLVQNPDRDLVNEPLEDLLEDIAAYSIIALCLRAEKENERGA